MLPPSLGIAPTAIPWHHASSILMVFTLIKVDNLVHNPSNDECKQSERITASELLTLWPCCISNSKSVWNRSLFITGVETKDKTVGKDNSDKAKWWVKRQMLV